MTTTNSDHQEEEATPWRALLRRSFRTYTYRRFGRRSMALLLLSAISILWGIALIIAPPVGHVVTLYSVLLRLASPMVWGVLWICGGTCAGVVALLRLPRDRLAFAAVSTLFVTWAAGTAVDWLETGFPRGWVTASLLALISLLIIVISGWPDE